MCSLNKLFAPFCLCLFLQWFIIPVHGQNDHSPEVSVGAYLDIFYGYDFNKPTTEQRLPYLYHHNRHNEFNLNHGYIFLKVDDEKYRANLAFQGGTYVRDNYSTEPQLYQNILDANIGLALNTNRTLWLDAGIFGNSWIGFESTESYPNFNLEHNLVSENVPYFMSGAKATFEGIENWSFAVLAVNGWQRIKRVPGNSLLSFGTQVNYSTGDRLQLNWSTFIGTDDPDSTRRMRYFHDLYAIFKVATRWELALGFDFGIQQKSKGSESYDGWYGLVAIVRYEFDPRTYTAARYEYYRDPNEVIVQSLDPLRGYTTSGVSLNLDRWIHDRILGRLEGRYFFANDTIYPEGSALVTSNFFIVASLSIRIEKSL